MPYYVNLAPRETMIGDVYVFANDDDDTYDGNEGICVVIVVVVVIVNIVVTFVVILVVFVVDVKNC